jgi:predicted RNase H-like HicB family nuclease
MSFYAIRLVEQRIPGSGASAWFAEHPALSGCHAVGKTPSQALAGLERSREAWLSVAQENGLEIPKPEETRQLAVIYLRKRLAARTRTESQAEPEIFDVEIGDDAETSKAQYA